MYEELILTHYSHSDILEPHSVEQKPDPLPKPRGLWLSVDSDYGWREWGQGNEYGCFDHCFEVELVYRHNVLITDDLLGFHSRFASPLYPDASYPIAYIKWQEVAKVYSGIIIPTYHFEFRFDTRVSDWYYGWDCASGCIWDAAAIASVSLAQTREAI